MRLATLLALFTFGFLFSLRSASAATEIPFVYRHGLIWLKVDVAGQSRALDFLLDSGASATVLDVQTAHRLGLKLGARESVRGVDGFCDSYRVAGLKAELGILPIAGSALALDLSPVSRACGERIDGLLGADFFRKRIVQIDFVEQKIRVLAAGELAAPGAQVIPLATRNDAMCVRVAVNGQPAQWVRLDTGCQSALEWVPGSAAAFAKAGTTIAPASGSRRSVRAEVTLGSEHLTAVKTGLHQQPMFSGESGLLGNGLLSQFRVTVDAAGARLFLDSVQERAIAQ